MGKDKMRRSITILALLIAVSAKGDDLTRFWQNFPEDGFTNKLSSYGYDRSYARTATVAFVGQAIQDLATNTFKARMPEYVCVMYYMDRSTVTAKLSALEKSLSPGVQNAARSVKADLESIDTEVKREHR